MFDGLDSGTIAELASRGVFLHGADQGVQYVWMKPEWMSDVGLAMDALPTTVTTTSGGIPVWMTQIIDPQVIEVLFSPNKAAEIYGEVRKGDWVDQTIYFPFVEHVGEVSSYGDYATTGHTNVNPNFPSRQAYLYQIIKEYGELEMDRAARAKIGWVAELDKAAVTILNKFQNLTYFFGVYGLENYGALNDPGLNAALTPATKAAGGTTWFNGSAPNATANEVYNDIVATFDQLINQANGVVDIDMEADVTLAMSPSSQLALKFTNQFGLTVQGMLKESFPNIKIKSAIQFGAKTTSNPQGVSAGNMMQMIVKSLAGVETMYCAFNEKLRTHALIRDLSSFKQKQTQGTWGTIIRRPFVISSMIGI